MKNLFTILFILIFLSISLKCSEANNTHKNNELIGIDKVSLLEKKDNDLNEKLELIKSKIDINESMINELKNGHKIITEDKYNSMYNISQQNIEIAGKIIDWSASFFALFVLIMSIAGFIGYLQIKQLKEIKDESSIFLNKSKSELSKIRSINEKIISDYEKLKIEMRQNSKNFMEILYLRGQAESNIESGDPQKAISILESIHDRNPDSPEMYFMLGVAYSTHGDPQKAIYYLQKATQLKNDYDEAYYELGKAYRRNNEFDSSNAALQTAITLNRQHGRAMGNLGWNNILLGNLDEAKKWYIKCKSINPTYPLPYLCIALIEYHNNTKNYKVSYDIAKELIEEQISCGRYRFWDIYHLAEIFLVEGNLIKANELYNKAISMNYAPETRRSILKRLQLLKDSENPPENIDSIITMINT